MFKDEITIRDRIDLESGDKKVFSDFDSSSGKEKVQIEGFFSCYCRERGKIVPGTRREGKNIWTLAGREHLARLMSYSSYTGPVGARNDRIRYIGFGIGTTPEVSTVSQLVSPVAYSTASGGLFLAELAIPTYPFQTIGSFGTAVRYTRDFSETEISTTVSVDLTEAGIFTDGSPTSSFSPGTRDLSLANAGAQVPNGYKTFEALKKTQNFVLSVAWEVRF